MKPLSWDEEKKRGMQTGEFHPDTRVDEVETLIERVGWDDAIAEIETALDQNPDDQEARRRAALILTLNDKRLASLKGKLQH